MLPFGLDLCIAYYSSKRNNTKCMDLVSHGTPVFRSTQRHMINRVTFVRTPCCTARIEAYSEAHWCDKGLSLIRQNAVH